MAMYDSDCLASGAEIDIMLNICFFDEDVYSISGCGDDDGKSCAFDQVIIREWRFEKLESDNRVYVSLAAGSLSHC